MFKIFHISVSHTENFPDKGHKDHHSNVSSGFKRQKSSGLKMFSFSLQLFSAYYKNLKYNKCIFVSSNTF